MFSLFEWIEKKLEPHVGYAEAGGLTMLIVIFACLGLYVLVLLLSCF